MLTCDNAQGRFSGRVSNGSLRVVQAPLVEPLTTAQAISHLRENEADVDLLDLQAKIAEARAAIEDLCGRALAPQLLELSIDGFPNGFRGRYDAILNEFELPMPPAISIESIIYSDGVTDTVMAIDAYRLDSNAQPAVVFLPYGSVWPTLNRVRNAVRVRYWAGYDAPSNSPDNNPLPAPILAAIKLMLGHLWENREATSTGDAGTTLAHELPLGIDSLLSRYNVRVAMA